PSGQDVLPRHTPPGASGADGGGHLPRARRAQDLRPHLCADIELQVHRLDVGLCPPPARRFPGGWLRLGRLDPALHDHRRPHRDDHRARAGAARGGGAMMMRRLIGKIAFWVLIAIIVVFAIFPFYYAIISSFRSGTALFSPSLVPDAVSFANYVGVFIQQP